MSWQRSVDRALAPLDLTHTQYWLLSTAAWLIDEVGDAVSQQEIAEAAQLDKMTASYLVRKLESRGLLDRGPTGAGRAAWRVIVTRQGYRRLAAAAPRIAALARAVASG